MSRTTDRQLVSRARAQHGLLGSSDATRILERPDAVRQLRATGIWQEPLPGVLAFAGLSIDRELLESAVMLWDPRLVLSHHSAARREGIWVPDHDDAWAVATFANPKRSRPGVQVHRTRHFECRVRSDGFHKWTVPARTLVDLAPVLTRKQFEAVLLSAIRLEKVTAAAVRADAEVVLRRRGLQVLREVTDLWTPERESMLEEGMHSDVLAVVPHGVSRQYEVKNRDGTVFARVDVAIEALRLAFEADGLYFHSTDAQIAADQRRDRGMLARGWQSVRFREGPLSDHASVQREILQIVERRRQDLRAA